MTTLTDALLAAFHATHYRVDAPEGAFVLRIGAFSAPLQRLHAAHGVHTSAYLTAWNPSGQAAPAAQNAARQAALRADLAALGIPVLEGEGRDPATGWAEASLLALGLAREPAALLAHRYGQAAFLSCGADAVPALVLLC